jgi:hypothetical protein
LYNLWKSTGFQEAKVLAGLQGVGLKNIKAFPFYYEKERGRSYLELIKIKDPAPFHP